MTRARTAYLPLMLQLAGIARSSGKKASRISRSRSARQVRRAGRRPFADAEFARRDEAAFPEALAFVPGVGLVRLEAAAGGGLDVEGKAVADQQLAEACGLALDLADADAPFLESGIGAEIVAANLFAVDQPGQLVARLDAAGPPVGILVDAELIDGGLSMPSSR